MAKVQRKQLSFHRVFSIFLSIVLLLLLISTEAFAQTTSTTTRLLRFIVFPNNFVTMISGGEAPVSDIAVGLEATIAVIDAPRQEQETWRWDFFNSAGMRVFNLTLFFFADGADIGLPGSRNCFRLAGSPFPTCNVPGVIQRVAIFTRCQFLATFRVNLEHTRSDGINETITSQTFSVVSTGPAPDVMLNPIAINPRVNSKGRGEIFNITPGQTDITVTVTDAVCQNIPLEGADVELSSKTIPNSGGHTHAHNVDQKGTGIFTLGPGSEITDQFGEVKATYTAGVVGLEEDIIAKATFRGTDKTGKTRLTIKIEGLEPMPFVPQEYKLTGETGNHPVGTNHFGTPDMVFRVFNIARIFRQFRTEFFALTGVLKINDMSLPNGGVFDICGDFNNLASMCAEAPPAGGHFSHEIGVDVDIERKDSKGVSIIPLLGKLKDIALEVDCDFIHAIHFRCVRPFKQ